MTFDIDKTDNIVCPYCGYEYDASYEANFTFNQVFWGDTFDYSKGKSLLISDYGTTFCDKCKKPFRYERHKIIKYTTEKIVQKDNLPVVHKNGDESLNY
jgi:DNA-directed RNA polymerase subunit RPC12/RpoP